MTQPLITIGITAYESMDTVERALTSALEQEWDQTEILIVDDCSSDQTADVVRRCIHNKDHCKLIVHEKNKGPAGARNTILNGARGEYIVFFDDDDWSHPHRVRDQFECIQNYKARQNDAMILCYASGERHYPNGYQKILNAIGSQGEAPHGKDMADRLLFYGGDPKLFYGFGTPTCALMAERGVFEKMNGFDESFRRVEDIDFSVRCALEGAHFIGCDRNLFTQFATESADKSFEMNLEAELKLAEKFQAYLRERQRYDYARTWPKIRYYHFKRDYMRFFLHLFWLWLKHPIAVSKHLSATGPARLKHEKKMRNNPVQSVQ